MNVTYRLLEDLEGEEVLEWIRLGEDDELIFEGAFFVEKSVPFN